MEDNFIEHKNFIRIYTNNFKYKKEHRRHQRALIFQLAILGICVALAGLNLALDHNFMRDLYLDQFNRIYALLVALLTAILIGLTPIDREGKLNREQYDYLSITIKQDYVSIIMYTLMLYMLGITINVLYAIFVQYLHIGIIDFSFWIIHIFVLLDSLFFTVYCVDELADIVKYIK